MDRPEKKNFLNFVNHPLLPHQLVKIGAPFEEDEGIDYPFGRPPFMNPNFEARYDQFMKLPLLPPLFIDKPTLLNHFCGEKVEEDLKACGLSFLWFSDDNSYKTLVVEFMATLNMMWKMDPTYGIAKCVEWSFSLGGKPFSVTNEMLWDFLECDPDSEEGSYDKVSPMFYADFERNAFWRVITGRLDAFFVEKSPSNLIMFPYWRIVHRLVAMNINTRKSGGRYVVKEDLDIMLKISDMGCVDPMEVFSINLRKIVNNDIGSRVLIGGFVVSRIAKRFGYILDKGIPVDNFFLDTETLDFMKLTVKGKWEDAPPPSRDLLRRENHSRDYKCAVRSRNFPLRDEPPSSSFNPTTAESNLVNEFSKLATVSTPRPH